jgi:hypothetical protein
MSVEEIGGGPATLTATAAPVTVAADLTELD